MAQPKNITVQLDINKYAKTWYEIARFPHRFETGLTHVSAIYQLVGQNKISVLNKGKKGNKIKQIKGTAWIPDPSESGKLKVRFFWPFAAQYWVHYVDDQYRVAIVGGSGSNYLWILADKPSISDEEYNHLVNIAQQMGYDITKLEKVNQE